MCSARLGVRAVPDDVFEGAARLAREDVTDAMDRVCAELGNPADKFVSSAAREKVEAVPRYQMP